MNNWKLIQSCILLLIFLGDAWRALRYSQLYDNITGESIGLKFIPSESELFQTIPNTKPFNQYEKLFVHGEKRFAILENVLLICNLHIVFVVPKKLFVERTKSFDGIIWIENFLRFHSDCKSLFDLDWSGLEYTNGIGLIFSRFAFSAVENLFLYKNVKNIVKSTSNFQ